jgi:hypothetical protein
MNDTRLSASMNKLLAAAKADTPSAAARTKMWSGVSGAVGGAAMAGGTAASALVTGGASATKVLAVGTLFGGSLAVGLATVLLQVGPTPKIPRTVDPVIEAPASLPPARPAGVESIWTRTPSPTLGPGPAEGAISTTPPAAVRAAAPHARRANHEDILAREASLVAEARGALARSDPRTALRAIRSARALPSRQLVPEELAVEEQALRALGRSDEANGIDVQLRLQYPEAALAR